MLKTMENWLKHLLKIMILKKYRERMNEKLIESASTFKQTGFIIN